MATKKSKIEAEVLEAVGDKHARKDGEAAAKYRARLIRALQELKDSEWNKMAQETQDWANAGVEAIGKKKEVPDFSDAPASDDADEDEDEKPAKKSKGGKSSKKSAKAADDEEEEEEEESDEEESEDDAEEEEEEEESDEDEDEKPAKKSKGGKSSKKSAKAAPEKKAAVKKGDGAIMVFRKILCKHPKYDRAKALEALSAKGHELADGTARQVFFNTRNTISALEELGMLEGASAE
jgi:hypothetical protein